VNKFGDISPSGDRHHTNHRCVGVGLGGPLGQQDDGYKELSKSSSNRRELTAVLYAIWSFLSNTQDRSVLLLSDNATVVSHINNFGGRVVSLDSLTRQIHGLCAEHRISIRAKHIRGLDNILADQLSWFRDPDDFVGVVIKSFGDDKQNYLYIPLKNTKVIKGGVRPDIVMKLGAWRDVQTFFNNYVATEELQSDHYDLQLRIRFPA